MRFRQVAEGGRREGERGCELDRRPGSNQPNVQRQDFFRQRILQVEVLGGKGTIPRVSPNPFDAIEIEQLIATDHRNLFYQRLSNDQTIERIAMIERQVHNLCSVGHRDG